MGRETLPRRRYSSSVPSKDLRGPPRVGRRTEDGLTDVGGRLDRTSCRLPPVPLRLNSHPEGRMKRGPRSKQNVYNQRVRSIKIPRLGRGFLLTFSL